MKHSDWLQPTRSKAAIVAAVLGTQSVILLVGFNTDRPVAAFLVGAASALPLLAAPRAPSLSVALSSVVTIAAPFLVDSATSVIYAFIAALIIYAWQDATIAWLSMAIGVTVLAVNEIAAELFEEAAEDGGSWRDVEEFWFVVPAVIEAIVISLLIVGLGRAVALTRRQSAAVVGLERANGRMELDAQRHRIARDLHDVAAHHLSSIVVRTSTAEKLGNSADMNEAVSFAGDQANEALNAMRQIVTILRNEQDIVAPGLADLERIAETSRAAGLQVSVDVDHSVPARLTSFADLALSRVTQEALANVVQHSDATEATVEVVLVTGPDVPVIDGGRPLEEVRLVVTDPGPPKPTETIGSGFGLRGMQERLESLGGLVEVGPNSEGGWTVMARLPLLPDSTAESDAEAAER